MRTLLLLLIGGGLLWWLLRDTPASVDAAASGTSASAGEMLPADPPPDSTPPTAESGPAPERPGLAPGGQGAAPAGEQGGAARPSSAPSKSFAEPAAAASTVLLPPTDGPGSRVEPTSSRSSAEVLVASRILHDPARIDEVLAGAGAHLPASRHRLARTLAALVAGNESEAAKLAQGLDTDAMVSTAEVEFVRRALAHSDVQPSSAAASRPSTLVHAASLGLMLQTAEKQLEKREQPRATCELLSRVLLEELDAEWVHEPIALRRWSELLRRAQVEHRWSRTGNWPAIELTVARGDSLITVRKRALEQEPALVLCTGLIARANQLSRDLIHPGQILRIPTQRVRMLVDLGAHWAFYLAGDEVVGAWEVGVGKPGRDTQPGTYYVGEKREEPMWFPPGEAPVPFGDPRNPLGTRWIELRTPAGEITHLGFHGTNEPDTVGTDASLGCVRMRNGDVEELYEILPRGSEVLIRP